MRFQNQSQVFVKCTVDKIATEKGSAMLLSQKCKMGHDFSPFISKAARILFICMSKNYVSDQNDSIQSAKKRNVPNQANSKDKNHGPRKIKNLTSV